MLADVVVDTDVFVHAETPNEADCEASRRFIDLLSATDTLLCFDPGFDVEESRNRSLIAGEYLASLAPGARALLLIQQCALTDRISIVDRAVPENISRALNRLVQHNKDRKFVRVAHNSQERVLVSHDDEHLHCVADALAQRTNVELLDAYGCCGRLR